MEKEVEQKQSSDYDCGLLSWKPECLQRFANMRGFMMVYGFLGTVQAMAYVYFVGTLTTIEKRFGIQSATTGWMLSGNEVSQILMAPLLSYMGGRSNRPVWISWGVAISALSCYVLASPHFFFGSGSDVLALTEEYGHSYIPQPINGSRRAEMPGLCTGDPIVPDCTSGNEVIGVPVLIFLSQFILGIGSTLYFALGQPYLDDNTKKKNTSMLLGMTMSLRMIGPSVGFFVVFSCLETFVNPTLTPTITSSDPRWIGAWWLGWVLLGTVMLMFSILIAIFPRELPRPGQTPYNQVEATKHSKYEALPLSDSKVHELQLLDSKTESLKATNPKIHQEVNGAHELQLLDSKTESLKATNPKIHQEVNGTHELQLLDSKTESLKATNPKIHQEANCTLELQLLDSKTESLKATNPKIHQEANCTLEHSDSPARKEPGHNTEDFFITLIKLIKNKLLIVNIFSGVFYILGGSGHMTFMARNMEVQWYHTASTSNASIGPLMMAAMVLGFLLSGWVITRFKPRPSLLFGWNVVVGLGSVIPSVLALVIYCDDIEIAGFNPATNTFNFTNSCNAGCGCESVRFAPVCHNETKVTFFSPCHAGCSGSVIDGLFPAYTNCSCIPDSSDLQSSLDNFEYHTYKGTLLNGYCVPDCLKQEAIFFMIVFFLHFLGSTGKIGNILVGYRAVEPDEKSFASGISLFFVSLFAFIPGPVIFGYLLDSACIFWDTTCGRERNCWFYDRSRFRVLLNGTSAVLTFIGVVLDAFVCYLGRKVKLYDEDEEEGIAEKKLSICQESKEPQDFSDQKQSI